MIKVEHDDSGGDEAAQGLYAHLDLKYNSNS